MEVMKFLDEIVSLGLATVGDPTSRNEIESFEEFHHFSLHSDFDTLYRRTSNISAFSGSLRINSLVSDDEYCVRDASDTYRKWRWPIPLEMYAFGDDGSGGPYGFWVSGQTSEFSPIVQVGEIFESNSMTICASSLSSFLLIQFSFHLLQDDLSNKEIVKKYVPQAETLKDFSDDNLLKNLSVLVDPSLKNFHIDPYKDRLSKDQVEEYAFSLKNSSQR